jgi:hypothetical protein
MKLLIIGQCFEDYGTLPYQSAHKSEERDVHLSAELGRLGWSVDLLTGVGDHLLSTGVQQVNWNNVAPERYDWILVSHYRGFWNLLQHREILNRVLIHQGLACNLDGFFREVNPLLPSFRLIGATTAPLAADYQRRFPAARTLVTPYGFPVFDLSLPNPYPTNLPVVIYVGRFIGGVLNTINRLAQDGAGRWEVWIAGLFTGQMWADCGDGPTINDDARKRLFDPAVRFISDLRPWRYPNVSWQAGHLTCKYEAGQIVGGHGPVNRCEIDPFLVHASVGINVVDHVDHTLSCKLFDYLGAGLPTISEEGPPNAGDVLSLFAGQICHRTQWAGAICRELDRPRDRSIIREAAQLCCGWPVIASRWDLAMKEAG